MTTRLITAPSALAVTLADAKANLRIDGTDMDALVTAWIHGVTAHAEHYIERAIMSQAWRVTLDAFPDAIRLANPPIVAVQSVKYLDVNGALQTLDPADYLADIISEPGYIVPAFGKTWPTTYEQINAVTVDYTCGYGTSSTDTPQGIKLYLLAKLAEQFDPASMYGDQKTNTVQASFIDSLLDRFKVYA